MSLAAKLIFLHLRNNPGGARPYELADLAGISLNSLSRVMSKVRELAGDDWILDLHRPRTFCGLVTDTYYTLSRFPGRDHDRDVTVGTRPSTDVAPDGIPG